MDVVKGPFQGEVSFTLERTLEYPTTVALSRGPPGHFQFLNNKRLISAHFCLKDSDGFLPFSTSGWTVNGWMNK